MSTGDWTTFDNWTEWPSNALDAPIQVPAAVAAIDRAQLDLDALHVAIARLADSIAVSKVKQDADAQAERQRIDRLKHGPRQIRLREDD